MIIIDNMKYACERCIRGHRASTCNHKDAKLIMIKPKGRPSTQCPHCKELRKLKNSHVACNCSQKHNPSAKYHDKYCACILTGKCDCCTKKTKRKTNIGTSSLSASPSIESSLSFDPNTATFMSSIDSPSSGAPIGSNSTLYTDSYENLPSPTAKLDVMSPDQMIDYITGVKEMPTPINEQDVFGSSTAQSAEEPTVIDGDKSKLDSSRTGPVFIPKSKNIPAGTNTHRACSNHREVENATDVVGGQLFDDFLSSSETQTLENYTKQQSGDDLLKSLGFDDALKEVSRDDEMKLEQQMFQHLNSNATKTFM